MFSSFEPGEVISIWHPQGYQHLGIYSGQGTAIHASKDFGCVVENPLYEFAGGRQIRRHGTSTRLQPWLVVENARRQIGRRYQLFSYNCEHFVREVSGFAPTSPQLQMVVLGVLAAASIWMLARG